MSSETLYIKLHPAVTLNFTKPVDFCCRDAFVPGEGSEQGATKAACAWWWGGEDLVGRLSRTLLWLQSGRRGWRVRVPKEGRRAGAPGTREP